MNTDAALSPPHVSAHHTTSPARVLRVAVGCFILSSMTSCGSSDGSEAPGVAGATTLSAHDRSQILAAAAAYRIEVANGSARDDLYDTVDVLANLGTPGPRGIDWGDPVPMTQGDREAIVTALAPRTVTFVPEVEYPDLQMSEVYAILTLSAPTTIDDRLTVVTGLWCGFSCGIGGGNVVERDAGGVWTIGEPVVPQWIA